MAMLNNQRVCAFFFSENRVPHEQMFFFAGKNNNISVETIFEGASRLANGIYPQLYDVIHGISPVLYGSLIMFYMFYMGHKSLALRGMRIQIFR